LDAPRIYAICTRTWWLFSHSVVSSQMYITTAGLHTSPIFTHTMGMTNFLPNNILHTVCTDTHTHTHTHTQRHAACPAASSLQFKAKMSRNQGRITSINFKQCAAPNAAHCKERSVTGRTVGKSELPIWGQIIFLFYKRGRTNPGRQSDIDCGWIIFCGR